MDHTRIFTMSRGINRWAWKMCNTWNAGNSGERIVLTLALFSGGDETDGNGPSTTDNEETELCMKESIDLSAPNWCCKPHAPRWGAGLCRSPCFTNRLRSLPEWSFPLAKACRRLFRCPSSDRQKNPAHQPDEVRIDFVQAECGGIVWHAPPSLWPLRSLLSWRGHCWGGSGECKPHITPAVSFLWTIHRPTSVFYLFFIFLRILKSCLLFAITYLPCC